MYMTLDVWKESADDTFQKGWQDADPSRGGMCGNHFRQHGARMASGEADPAQGCYDSDLLDCLCFPSRRWLFLLAG